MKAEPVPKIVRQLLDLKPGEHGYHVVYDGEDLRTIAKRLRTAYGQHARRYGRGQKYRVRAFDHGEPFEIKGNLVVVITRLR